MYVHIFVHTIYIYIITWYNYTQLLAVYIYIYKYIIGCIYIYIKSMYVIYPMYSMTIDYGRPGADPSGDDHGGPRGSDFQARYFSFFFSARHGEKGGKRVVSPAKLVISAAKVVISGDLLIEPWSIDWANRWNWDISWSEVSNWNISSEFSPCRPRWLGDFHPQKIMDIQSKREHLGSHHVSGLEHLENIGGCHQKFWSKLEMSSHFSWWNHH